ncbi:MAG: hypothetical protein H6631_13790 [Anaerolineaceae bacterium]|nr:hypothetical protein [Anaerolineaceae bacterium]
MKQSAEQHIRETGLVVIKHDLEDNIRRNCEIAGIRVMSVNVDVILSKALSEHLQRVHNRLYSEGGTADRRRIDELIDYDTTFSPYSLREIIRFLDMGLLENFYTMEWSSAMRKVYDKLAEAKADYFKAQQESEINRLRKLIGTARDVGLDSENVEDLKEKLAQKLLAMADEEERSELPSDNQFLRFKLGDNSAGRLTSGSRQQLAAPTGDDAL